MKKFSNPIPNGGAPLHGNRLNDLLGVEMWTAIESILQGIAPTASTGNVGVIVSGCAVTGSGPYNISSGIVYLNGQFMAFPGATSVTLPQYIIPATLVNIAYTFADGNSRNLITQQDATITGTLPGSGQYITMSTTGNLGAAGGFRFENWVNAGVNSQKSDKALPSWTNITIQDAATAVNWTNVGANNLAYRVTDQKRIEVRGKIQHVSGFAQEIGFISQTSLGVTLPAAGQTMGQAVVSGSLVGRLVATVVSALPYGSIGIELKIETIAGTNIVPVNVILPLDGFY